MGHYFVFNRSSEIMGINHGGTLLVARRDKVDPAIQLIKESIRKTSPQVEGIQKAVQISAEIMYPFGYISSFEGATKYKDVYELEKRTYAIFENQFYESFINFCVTDIKVKIDSEFIEALLVIFLHDSSKLTFELQLSGKVLRIAEKPSATSRLFTSNKTGDTLHSCLVSEISEIEISQKQVRFFTGDYENESNNFMTLTRDRCYTSS
jgi:hypothetical protein